MRQNQYPSGVFWCFSSFGKQTAGPLCGGHRTVPTRAPPPPEEPEAKPRCRRGRGGPLKVWMLPHPKAQSQRSTLCRKAQPSPRTPQALSGWAAGHEGGMFAAGPDDS